MIVDLGEGVVFQILFPDRDVALLETNDASVVGKLIFEEISFLFTGDSPQKIEKYLIFLDPNSLSSKVLKVGHHGSRTSSGAEFVGAVDPQYAVISSGKDNSYGHPYREVLEILDRNKSFILNTAEVGRVVFKTDGKNLTVDAEK